MFQKRRCMSDQKAHENMLRIIGHVSLNHNGMLLHAHENGYFIKKKI